MLPFFCGNLNPRKSCQVSLLTRILSNSPFPVCAPSYSALEKQRLWVNPPILWERHKIAILPSSLLQSVNSVTTWCVVFNCDLISVQKPGVAKWLQQSRHTSQHALFTSLTTFLWCQFFIKAPFVFSKPYKQHQCQITLKNQQESSLEIMLRRLFMFNRIVTKPWPAPELCFRGKSAQSFRNAFISATILNFMALSTGPITRVLSCMKKATPGVPKPEIHSNQYRRRRCKLTSAK